jgi:gamma-glutamylcyclotransferase (GGCT)/AIG2-like uncharacterized protein YtfP
LPRLFVYGTLRRGHSAAHLLQSATFLSGASVRADVVEHDGYPALIPSLNVVHGELFDIPEVLFGPLDHYEGLAYVRRLTEVRQDAGPIDAWVYWLRMAANGCEWLR